VSGDGKEEDRKALERAMADVRRLDPGPAKIRAPRRTPVAAPAPKAKGASQALVAVGEGENLGFYAADVGPDLLRKLRRGELAMDRELDLHGLTLEQARHAVGRALREMTAGGLRGLRIVHGRGRHSAGPAVLPDLVRECLTHPPLAALVAAFASAPRREGGAGATHVYLRRGSSRKR
jgi:DNA-nicking Smr family endonuclease